MLTVVVGCSVLDPGDFLDDPGGDQGDSPGNAPGGEDLGTPMWSDAPVRRSTLSIDATALPAARSIPTGDAVYFRSSDIEFWSISSVADIGELVSTKYVRFGGVDTDYSQHHSLEYVLGDHEASIVFSPQEDRVQAIDRPELNPQWSSNVEAFIAAGNSILNAMRLDVGGGYVTFKIDGEQRTVCRSDGEELNGIDANSIFFVDEKYLSEPVLITRETEHSLFSGELTPASLGISEADFAVAETIHRSSNLVDSESPIDVNGALILPMTSVDLSGFDPASESLQVQVSWEIAGAVHEYNGEYFIDCRVGGTAFDFAVEVIRAPK